MHTYMYVYIYIYEYTYVCIHMRQKPECPLKWAALEDRPCRHLTINSISHLMKNAHCGSYLPKPNSIKSASSLEDFQAPACPPQ